MKEVEESRLKRGLSDTSLTETLLARMTKQIDLSIHAQKKAVSCLDLSVNAKSDLQDDAIIQGLRMSSNL